MDEEDDFDFIQPTLIQQLKNILDDYPDDGQILKELVQNAEDAGAKEVKFLFDNRTYGKSKLYCPELEQFQGPALYAYNDAQFKAEDWNGVRMISDSIKAKDPMKVGRFGLGFKSVFHLTDLPSVVSDKQLAMIDPHEKYFGPGRTGKKWILGGQTCNMESISEQFDPYKGIFDCSEESFINGHYPGTLFRFPLRECPSELSDTIYTKEKMIGLFKCFQTDAQLILLFLKRLESIELYVRHEGDISPTKVFQVRIAKDFIEEVRSKRKEFLEKISSPKDLSESVAVTYPVTIETITYAEEENFRTEKYSYIVTDYYSGDAASYELNKLSKDESLSYLPWVGVAYPVPPKSARNILENEDEPATEPCGHLFCFLPLPLSKQSPTGLPVHVNGFFALSKNRRYLKWPSADQDETQTLTDKALLWNRCLLREVIPKAYATLLRETINLCWRLQDSSADAINAVYSLWPDMEKADLKWKEVTELFYKEILYGHIVYTEADKGKWILLQEALLDNLQESNEVNKAIISTLCVANQNVVTVPPHVMAAIKTHYSNSISEITPSRVRHVLKNMHSVYKGFDSTIKLRLLQYILSDRNFSDLCGLELLPLSDGTFTTFKNNGLEDESKIYIASRDHPQTLLPGLEKMFLSQEMDSKVLHWLLKAAETECLQLCLLKASDVQRLLRKVLRGNQNEFCHVKWETGGSGQQYLPAGWLEELWLYLCKNFPSCLDPFQGLHLIQVKTSSESTVLAQLQKRTTLVAREVSGSGLNEALSDILRKLGLTVIDALPNFTMTHPECFQFVNKPTVQGILKALSVIEDMGTNDLVRRIKENISPNEKRQLRSFLAQAKSFTVEEKQLVSRLPLFETLDGSGKKASFFVAASQVRRAAPTETLPVSPSEIFIIANDDECRHLARALEIKQLTTMELLSVDVLPGVAKNYYSGDELDYLMVFVLERLPQYRKQDKNFDQHLRWLPFVSRSRDGRRVKPSDLFDPNVEVLRNIFLSEDEHFPSAKYRDDSILIEMRKLGLKTVKEVKADMILESVKQVERMRNYIEAECKSKAILTFLNENPSVLRERISSGVYLADAIRSIRWVSRIAVKPIYYPDDLPFYSDGTSPFDRPDSMVANTKRLLSLVGTTRPSVQVDLYSKLKDHFYWESEPELEDVIAQFKSVTSTYNPLCKASYLGIVIEVYQYLSSKDHRCVNKALISAGIKNWIWNGEAFSSPDKIVVEKPFTDLSPYAYSLPSEMKTFTEMFIKCGVKIKEDQELLVTVLHQMRKKYEIKTNVFEEDVRHDLQLSIDILNEMKPSSGKEMPREILEKLLLPIDVENNFTLRLHPIKDCTYCDTEWLKHDYDMYDAEENDDIGLHYVHRNVPPSTAQRLGVPSLMSRILDPDQLGFGEEYGQSEPLTRRINRLLEDYTDGFAVPKELIQNADDAGATEVKILYDERSNMEARTCLIDEGMQEWQGQALWAYNDAAFTDKDFENITKLSEGTKEKDSGKIGRFGLGFNAVYNLTDVPSFVSRNKIVIFDPHTTYLGKAVRNKQKPGIKIDIMKNKRKLRKLRNQFKPYNGIFGCDLSLDAEETFFNGTLFRFPLRNRSQADKSEIKSLFYDKEQMTKLLEMVVKGADTLLLFTQNVRRVTLLHLPSDAKDPTEAVELFHIEKKPINTLCQHGVNIELSDAAVALSIEEQKFIKECNFLKATSQVMQNMKQGYPMNEAFPQSSMNISVLSSFTKAGHVFFANVPHTDSPKRQAWLVSSSMGQGISFNKAKGDERLRPAAGVAVRLVEDNCTSPVGHMNPARVAGCVFCYLPLPIDSKLSVHINGGFAVTSNRRYLKERSKDDKDDSGGEWNEMLLKDAVCEAYLTAMQNLCSMMDLNSAVQSFYELWPLLNTAESFFDPLVRSFYTFLVQNSLKLFTDGKRCIDIENALFLKPELRQVAEVGDVALDVLRQVSSSEKVVIDLPSSIAESLERCGYGATLLRNSYDIVRFYSEIFVPHIEAVNAEERDTLTLYALHTNRKDLDDILKKSSCIPVTPDGKKLKSPDELVHPTGDISSVFLPEEEKFPHGSDHTYLNDVILAKLVHLGMAKDEMRWDMIVERAQSCVSLNLIDHVAAVKRGTELCRLLERKLSRRHSEAEPVVYEKEKRKAQEKLLEIPFLPALTPPKDFPFAWETTRAQLLVSAKQAYPSHKQNLVCASAPLICDDLDGKHYLTEEVKIFLKLDKKTVPKCIVLKQLKQAMLQENAFENKSIYNYILGVCKDVYNYLQSKYDDLSDDEKAFLKQEKVILINDGFVSASYVAHKCPFNFSPYLYSLADTAAATFTKLEVQDNFSEKDYVTTLCRIRDTFGTNSLHKISLRLVVEMLEELARCIESLKDEAQTMELGNIYLPDSEGILHMASDLCINDCVWVPKTPGVRYTHPKIPPETCKILGVKTMRTANLTSCSIGISFGQKEKLTNRLRGILDAYPCGQDVLKELLQNADDAQATEICFISDPRHHNEDFLFEDSWKHLQGPALLVYNNKPFKKSDLDGIQNLGEGSKRDDPNKTGQYGVGFNSVYHLTDVPSFISKGAEIGDVLCALDPHCKYVPGATREEPGRMFKNIDELEELYKDVFPCYKLGNRFPLKDAVMFRFPLRTNKMTETSEISSSEMTQENLKDLMNEFKSEMFEYLLFVNNVKEISLWEVDEISGEPVECYRVKATIQPDDEKKRQEFGMNARRISQQLKKGEERLSEIQMEEVAYVMTIEDSQGRKEDWFVVQRTGFEEKTEIPQSVLDAYDRKELGLLPRGGVATVLNSTSATSHPMKAYCFLPLPQETGLPVNINGHFALDHEARRNLWRDEDYRGEWNKVLLQGVIAPCYVITLCRARSFLQLEPNENHVTSSTCTTQEMTLRLKKLRVLLPGIEENFEDVCWKNEKESKVGNNTKYPLSDPYWIALTQYVYQYINQHQVRILPVVRGFDAKSNISRHPEKLKHSFAVYWFFPCGKGKDEAFFNDLQNFPCPPSNTDDEKKRKLRHEMQEKIKLLLLRTGFNLVEFPLSVFEVFRMSGVDVSLISPSAVIEFYKSFNREESLCNIGCIPAPIASTPFENEQFLFLMLHYCKTDDDFRNKLDGLPLLLTCDNQLRCFSCQSPKFLSRFYNLLPDCLEMFVHPELHKIFFATEFLTHDVFKEFNVKEFASLLSHAISPKKYYERSLFSEWFPDQETVPNRDWLQTVWRFLSNQVHNMLKVKLKEKLEDMKKEEENKNPGYECRIVAHSDKEKQEEITVLLEPLKDWSILPATEVKSLREKQMKTNDILVPLKLGKCILEFRFQDETKKCLCNILRDLGLPELNKRVLESSYTTDTSRITRQFVATLDEPTTVLEALNQQMNRLCLKGKLNLANARSILTYFSENTESLRTPEHIEILKRLPLHETIHGSLVEIASQTAIVLPLQIPSAGIDAVEKCSCVVFLKKMFSLEKLHDFMGCKPISPVDVYCNVIFLHFHKIEKQGKIDHLNYIRNDLLPRLPKEDKEGHRQKLIFGLSNLTFLPKAKSHSYGKVSSFYDPRVAVFKVMLSPELFPPKPFDEPEWLDFLCDIGLVKNVTKEKFLEFANEVAREASASRRKETIKKSKTLVNHLFSKKNLPEDDDYDVFFLQKVSSIPFIASEKVSENLSSLHPQYQLLSDGQLPYSSFTNAVAYKSRVLIWTTAHLLPEWASPRFHFGLKDGERAISLIKGLGIAEQPSLEQVTQHCLNLCNKLVDENDKSESFDEKRFDVKIEVMSLLYNFFQSNIFRNKESGQTRQKLQNTPCILVESGKRFVYPHQVVIEFFESQEIKPYLYATPRGLAQFRNFFEFVGSPRKAGCREYAVVLQMIQQLWPEKISDPNAVYQVLDAVKGFFKCVEELESSCSAENLKELYLPGYTKTDSDCSKPLPMFLRQAKSLIYNDAPCHNERLKQFSEMFLLDLKECGINKVNIKDDLLTKIPKKHRPNLLSEVVKEELVENPRSAVPLGADHSLQKTLVSQEFCRGIVRLIRHENHDNGVPTMENIVTNIERKLQNIKLFGVEKVVTHLVHKGKVIPGSQKDVLHFQTEEIKGNEIIWKIYLSKSLVKSEEIDPFLSIAITNAIQTIACGQLRDSTAYVLTILGIPVHSIWSVLDQMQIRQDDTYDPSQNTPLPEPGSFVPVEDHHLLDNAFNEFDVGDYAGLEVFDASDSEENDDATFIYVVVMEKIQNSGVSGPALNCKYKINIGCNRDPVIVTASKLYKFHKVIRFSPEGCVVFADEENLPKPQGRQEIFREITQLLEEAWRLSEEERRRIIKRLYLRWHPDKNLGNEEFCKEVCHFIQSEIRRLSSRTTFSYGSSGGFYSTLFTFCGKRASRHRKSRNRYRDAFVQRYPRGSGISLGPFCDNTSHPRGNTRQYVPPTFQKANPQPQEAKRWLRQAEMDLEAASNDEHVTNEYYEWACFKHHQAAEKALKAAHFMLDADKSDTHNLVQNANRLDNPELRDLSARMEDLLGNSDNMRYPDTMCSPHIPHEVYKREMAEESQELAQTIVSIVTTIVRGEGQIA